MGHVGRHFRFPTHSKLAVRDGTGSPGLLKERIFAHFSAMPGRTQKRTLSDSFLSVLDGSGFFFMVVHSWSLPYLFHSFIIHFRLIICILSSLLPSLITLSFPPSLYSRRQPDDDDDDDDGGRPKKGPEATFSSDREGDSLSTNFGRRRNDRVDGTRSGSLWGGAEERGRSVAFLAWLLSFRSPAWIRPVLTFPPLAFPRELLSLLFFASPPLFLFCLSVF